MDPVHFNLISDVTESNHETSSTKDGGKFQFQSQRRVFGPKETVQAPRAGPARPPPSGRVCAVSTEERPGHPQKT